MAQTTNIDELQKRFGKTGAVRVIAGNNSLACVELTSAGATAQLYLLGAHLTQFQPNGEPPVLWVSAKSNYEPGKEIRGGVPVILPWFAKPADNPEAPQHGLVRTVEWNLVESHAQGAEVGVTLSLASTPAMHKWFPHDFEASFSVKLTNTLKMTLQMRNPTAKAWKFEEALHTYFAVSDVRKIRVDGLSGAPYWSKVENVTGCTKDGPITFAGRTDRVYLNTTSACTIQDPDLGRKIVIDKTNSASAVVWNPWIEQAQLMPDFGLDEWTGMVCVETCNIRDNAIELAPGKSHQMTAKLRSQSI
jgi:D-hexose-6-phosphate mutarotase